MVDTIKFSEFVNGGDIENDETTVGLRSGSNTRFNNPWVFLNPGATGDRPTPAPEMYYRLRFNTSLEVYEYYSPILVDWVTINSSISPSAPSDATYLIQEATVDLPNAVPLELQNSGFLVNELGTGFIATRIIEPIANQTTVNNDDGVAGNPQIGIADNPILPGTAGMGVPAGTSAQRVIPTPPNIGLRFNTDLQSLEAYIGGVWVLIPSSSVGFLPLSGGTMSGIIDMDGNTIQNVPLPVADSDVANKEYVDLTASGFVFVNPVRVASTANFTSTYNNGASGVGATLTATVNGAANIDGVALSLNDRVLFKNQTNTFENGICTVTQVGDGSTPAIYTRATNFDTPADIQPGDLVPVLEGTVNEYTTWLQTATVTTIGTDPIIFVQFGISLNNLVTINGNQTITGQKTFSNDVIIDNNSFLTLNSTTAIDEILDEDDMISDSDTAVPTQQSVKAYVDANSGSVAFNNMLYNSTFIVAQRGSQFTAATTPANNDGNYLIDGWVNLSDGNDVVDINQGLTGIPRAWGGNRYECLVATANKQFGAVQFVESSTSVSPIFENCALTAFISAYLPGTAVTISSIRFAILEWTGTTDTMTKDPISVWASGGSNPTLAANWAYVAISNEITLNSTARVFKIQGTTTANANNVAFIWWCSDADATLNDQLAISGAWLFAGDVTAALPADGTATNNLPENFLPYETVGSELRSAQRYFNRWVTGNGFFIINGSAVTTSVTQAVYQFPIAMRTSPTLAFSNLTHFLLQYGGSTTVTTGLAISGVSSRLASVDITTAAVVTTGFSTLLRSNSASAFLQFSAEMGV